MFIKAIQEAAVFTQPVHTVHRYYNSNDIISGSATVFMVNNEGWALTCKHVTQLLLATEQILKRKNDFLTEQAKLKGTKKEKVILRELEAKYGLKKSVCYDLLCNIGGCVDSFTALDIRNHPDVDLALLRFEGFNKILPTSFPFFAKNTTDLQPGKFVCRLGFPFPEFTHFELDVATDSLRWNATGLNYSPRYPNDGMVTRLIGSDHSHIQAFETTTPGIRGQSGGPAFDEHGVVWGMQAATAHHDLNFDVVADLRRDHELKNVKHHAFLHVGHCIHVQLIKEFMQLHKVSFAEK